MNISYTKHTLANGLDVLIHEDHSVPIVAVNVWYHVGSKNETPGPHRLRAPLRAPDVRGVGALRPRLLPSAAGGGGRRSTDRPTPTAPTTGRSCPTNALDLALWMESDRMGYLLPALTDAKFANQREVVLNERRQNYENRPYGLAGMAIVAALYPADHPYHWLTIGERRRHPRRAHRRRARVLPALLPSGATPRWRWPATSTRRRGLALAEHYFDEIPGGREAGPRGGAGARAARRRTCGSCSRIASSCRASIWPGTRRRSSRDGDAELDLVAEVLSSGKTSRLYRALVYEQRIATEVAASQNSREAGQLLPDRRDRGARAHARRSRARRSRREMAGLIERGPTDGGARALPGAGRGALPLPPADGRRLRRQVRSVERLQHVSRRSRLLRAGSRALPLGDAARSCARRPPRHLKPVRARRAERRPARPRRAGAAGLAAGGGVLMAADRSRLPALGPERPFAFPAIRRTTLANGLRVWTVEHHQVPLVVGARAAAGRRVVGSAGPARARRDHRRHARRRRRRSLGARRARSARPDRRAARHRGRPRRDGPRR